MKKILIFVFSFIIINSLLSNTNSGKFLVQLSEKQKIEILINSIEKLEGAQFYRNGSWYSPKEAAEHLRLKLSNSNGRIKTARQFIDKIASKSSMSGKAYIIKFKDGKTIGTGVFLHQQLINLR
jgi:hypothetical protein